MAIEEILIPEDTAVFGWNLGGHIIEIETLNKIVNIYYVSSSTKAYEQVEIDTSRKTVTAQEMVGRSQKAVSFSEQPPRDFAAVVQAAYSEITAGGVYNKYDRKWGNERYGRITSALRLALEILAPQESSKEDRISFNPGAYLKLHDGTLSLDQKSYFAELEPKELPTARGEVVVERDLFIALRADGFLNLVITHKLDGAVRWRSEAQVPNEQEAVGNLLKNYYASDTYTIGGWVLNI